jgi:hypothetical protein
VKFGFLIVLSEKSITFFKQENVYGQIDLGFELGQSLGTETGQTKGIEIREKGWVYDVDYQSVCPVV